MDNIVVASLGGMIAATLLTVFVVGMSYYQERKRKKD